MTAALVLVQFLEDGLHPAATRCLSADAIGMLAGAASGPAALALAATGLADDDPCVRRHTALALRRLGAIVSAPAVMLLARALRDDADTGVRRHAAQALGALGDLARPAATELARALGDASPDVRRNAAQALRDMGGPGDGGGSAGLVRHLEEALRDPSFKVRRSAAEAAGRLGALGGDAVKALGEAALRDGHREVRRRAVDALGLVAAAGAGVAAAVEVLGQAVLRDADMGVRRLAAVALSRQGTAAMPALGQLRAAAQDLAAEEVPPGGVGDGGGGVSSRGKVLGLIKQVLWKLDVTLASHARLQPPAEANQTAAAVKLL